MNADVKGSITSLINTTVSTNYQKKLQQLTHTHTNTQKANYFSKWFNLIKFTAWLIAAFFLPLHRDFSPLVTPGFMKLNENVYLYFFKAMLSGSEASILNVLSLGWGYKGQQDKV